MESKNAYLVRNRIISFDLICVFSCLCITIVHFNASVCGYNGTFVYPQNSLIPNFYLGGRVYLGGIGVSLFFMLSGARQMYSYRGKIGLFYKKRILNLFPMYWIAYISATVFDFLYYKGMSLGNPLLYLFSFLGIDGYLCSFGLIPFDFYKLGEWFLGCILCLYCIFPILHWGMEKHPLITVAVSLGVYTMCIDKTSDLLFVLRIPEMLFGMMFVKYRWEEKSDKLLLLGGGILFIAWCLRDAISSLSLCIAVCVFIFSVLVNMSKWIKKESVKKALAYCSNLTYPVFLVHHWLIDRLIMGFDLEIMPRCYMIMIFMIYLIFTLILSSLLISFNKKIISTVQNLRQ